MDFVSEKEILSSGFIFYIVNRRDDSSLLVLPKNDKAFSEAAQKDLRDSMPRALVKWVNAGHTATLFKVDTYVDATREFIKGLEGADAS